jgi:hypothetical protein
LVPCIGIFFRAGDHLRIASLFVPTVGTRGFIIWAFVGMVGNVFVVATANCFEPDREEPEVTQWKW